LHTLKKNKDFSHVIAMDEKWRLLIRNHISRTGMDLYYFSRKLLDNGFKIGPATVKNWIDGETQRPDNFTDLLHALCRMGIVNNDEIPVFDRDSSNIKSIQAGFVRTAIRRIISKLNGIHIEEDEVFTDDLLSNFISHIEIKRINNIYKL
jgi:hypothetical protein